MALRPEFTLEAANLRGSGRLPGLFGFRVTALSDKSSHEAAKHDPGQPFSNRHVKLPQLWLDSR